MCHNRRSRRNTRTGSESYHVLAKEYRERKGEDLVKELQNHVKKVTAPYKYPRVIEFVDELPKTLAVKSDEWKFGRMTRNNHVSKTTKNNQIRN